MPLKSGDTWIQGKERAEKNLRLDQLILLVMILILSTYPGSPA